MPSSNRNKKTENTFLFFNRHKVALFAGIFIVTFSIVGSLGFISPKFRNFLHASAGLVSLAGNDPLTSEVPPGEIFSDVPAHHPNAKAIAYLKKTGVVGGYEDGSFKPNNPLKRAELPKFIVLTLKADPHPLSNSFCFSDVKDEWFAKYVCFAKSKNWVKGFLDGGFHPENNVTKAEALKIVLAAFEVKLDTVAPSQQFSDVPVEAWFAPYVWTAQQKGWLEEKSQDGLYNPQAEITRAQLAEVLFRVLASELPTL